MAPSAPRSRLLRRVLVVVLILAVLVLAVTASILVPILTHQSAGGSGQRVPEGFVSSASAEGADGRIRELSVESVGGGPVDLSALKPGDELIVRGTGYNAGIGIYVSICAVPGEPGGKPSPCLGGMPEGAMQGEASGDEEASTSVWISDDWAWRAFATKTFDNSEAGAFTARLLVAEPVQEGLDCTASRCAITTRADHTASSDRVQDMQLPVAFAE